MKALRSIISIAASGVFQRPIRSLLTTLTASIGIASVVASMAILKGARRQINEDLSKLGLNIIVVQNLAPSLGTVLKSQLLTMSDLERIRRELSGNLEAIAPAVFRRYSVSSPPEPTRKTTTIIGTTAEFGEMFNLRMRGGRFLQEEDVLQNRPVCVMDLALVYDVFGSNNAVGREIEIVRGTSKIRLSVVGVLDDPYKLRRPRGQLDTVAMSRSIFASRLEFKNIYLPLGLVRKEDDNLNTVLIKVQSTDRVEEAMSRLEKLFASQESQVVVLAQKEWILETLRSIHDFTGYSNIIWMVMVAVAAVMITTIRLLSVRERFREIAIRRTEGATKRAIALQFAVEGVLLCASGGLAGIGLGVVLAKLIEVSLLRWQVAFSVSSILIAAGLSVGVGILSGVVPAKRAAALEPVEVLRMS